MTAAAAARTARGIRSREIELTPSVGLALFVGWAAAAALATYERRGELLELALIGVAGWLSWLAVRGLRLTAARLALLSVCFAAPLLNTWPLRVYDSRRVGLDWPLWALTGIPSALVLAAALLHVGWRRRIPPLLGVSALLLVVAAATSSLAAADRGAAAAAAFVTLVVPAAFGILLVQTVRTTDLVVRYLAVAVAAAGVPAAVGIAAYVLDFGLPHSGSRLVEVKRLLYRPHLFQNVTFGNVGHLADFALLLLAPAVAVVLARGGRLRRVTGGLVAFGLAGALVLTASRSALAIGAVETVLVAAISIRPRRLRLLPAALALLLLVVLLSPGFRSSYEQLVPVQGATGSSEVRLSAARTAWRIFERHDPWGVGTGRYVVYDPVHGAPHSLPLLLLTENGVPGLAGLAALLLFLAGAGVALVRRGPPRSDPRFLVTAGSLGGAASFLAAGFVAGVPLAKGPVTTWSLVLWLLVACLAVTLRPEESA